MLTAGLQKVRRACLSRRSKVQLRTHLRAVSHIRRQRVSWVTAIPVVERQDARKATVPLRPNWSLQMRADEAAYFETDRSVIVLKFIDGLVALVRRYLAYRQRRKDLAALARMNERELKDTGLYRYEIDRLSRY
jgi:uncharacterized protein YjiS (DUF1127 family)